MTNIAEPSGTAKRRAHRLGRGLRQREASSRKHFLDAGNVPLEQAGLAEHIPGSPARLSHGVPREAAFRGAARDLEGDRDDGFELVHVRQSRALL